MKSLKKLFVCLVVLVGIVTLTGCNSSKGIVGKWEYESGGYVYTFNADGTGNYDAYGTKMEFTYTTEGEKLAITYNGNTSAFETTYKIDGKKLIIMDSFGNETNYIKK